MYLPDVIFSRYGYRESVERRTEGDCWVIGKGVCIGGLAKKEKEIARHDKPAGIEMTLGYGHPPFFPTLGPSDINQ